MWCGLELYLHLVDFITVVFLISDNIYSVITLVKQNYSILLLWIYYDKIN